MTASMTAFARIESSQDWGTLVWEIRTVNHRYLEPHFRLPDSLREIEPRLRDLLRKNLRRGKVECSLNLMLGEGSTQIHLNQPLLHELSGALETVSEIVPKAKRADVLEILRWPGVLEQSETDIGLIHNDAVDGFENALKQVQKFRECEGKQLKQFIVQRLEGIDKEAAIVRQCMPDLLKVQRDKISQRLIDAKIEVDPNRLEQELVVLAQKSDVEEELDRLATHVQEVTRVLESQGAVGRRLDFLMQELNREANTLGSKALGVEVSQSAVNLKVLIEQMREQVQNIE